MAQAETAAHCTGDFGCDASVHIHGCFSDYGKCDATEEHAVAGPGHVADVPVPASEPTRDPKAGCGT